MLLVDEKNKLFDVQGNREQAFIQVQMLLCSYLVSLNDRNEARRIVNVLNEFFIDAIKNNTLKKNLETLSYYSFLDKKKFEKEVNKMIL